MAPVDAAARSKPTDAIVAARGALNELSIGVPSTLMRSSDNDSGGCRFQYSMIAAE
jgi:hypothetical protein